MKKIIEKVLQEALKKFLDILLNALERMIDADLNGDGTIGGKKDEEQQ